MWVRSRKRIPWLWNSYSSIGGGHGLQSGGGSTTCGRVRFLELRSTELCCRQSTKNLVKPKHATLGQRDLGKKKEKCFTGLFWPWEEKKRLEKSSSPWNKRMSHAADSRGSAESFGHSCQSRFCWEVDKVFGLWVVSGCTFCAWWQTCLPKVHQHGLSSPSQHASFWWLVRRCATYVLVSHAVAQFAAQLYSYALGTASFYWSLLESSDLPRNLWRQSLELLEM